MRTTTSRIVSRAPQSRLEGARNRTNDQYMEDELTQVVRDADEAPWSVWRQDDNGNRTVISRSHTREEAERLVRAFEARGHKQLYWASAADDASSPR